MLSICLFGQPRLAWDGQPVTLNAPPRTLPLLAYLLLHRRQVLERQQVAFTLWPDDPEAASRANLRRHLHWLARALPPASPNRPWLKLTARTVGWNPEADFCLDVADFERLAADPERIPEALALAVGDLLETVYDDWVFFERERLRERVFALLEQMAQQRRQQGCLAEAIHYTQQLLGRDVLREDALRRLMALRYEAGDRAGALAEYERFAARLRAEMHVEPMPETRTLHEIVLRQGRLPSVLNAPLPGAAAHAQRGQHTLAFVGRESEMEQLRHRWNRAVHGQGGMLLIGGEAGVGKSRLVQELAVHVEAQGGRVLMGQTAPGEMKRYQAVIEALYAALPLLAAIEGEITRLGVVAGILPELRQRRNLPTPTGLPPDRQRSRLFDALAGCLERLAEPRPLLLILEDLHWAGESTLALVEFLARRFGARTALVVATYREEETAPQHPLRELRRALKSDHLLDVLALNRLGRPAVEALLRLPTWQGLAGENPQAAAQQLFHTSEGNPLFLSLLLQHGLEMGRLAVGHAPKTLRAAVAGRLAQLSPQTGIFAEAAAMFGAAFDVEAVCQVAGWEECRSLEALDELLDRRLVREGGSDGDYAFTHNLIQAALVEAIPAARLRRRHHRAGEVLERLYPERRVALAARLAQHFDLGGEPQRAVPYYLQAARNSLAVFADAEAYLALGRALQLANETGFCKSNPAMCFDMLEMREQILNRMGDPTAQLVDIQALAALAQSIDDYTYRCRAALAEIKYWQTVGRLENNPPLIERLKSLAQANDDLNWQATAWRRQGLGEFMAGRAKDAAPILLKALDFARAAGDVEAQVETLARLAETAIYLRDSLQTERWIAQALALQTPQTNADLMIRLLWSLAAARLINMDSAGCIREAERALALAEQANDLNWQGSVHRLLAQAHSRQFHVEATRRHLHQAMRLYTLTQRQNGLAMVYQTMASLELDLGQYTLAYEHYQQALEIAIRIGKRANQAEELINLSNTASFLEDYLAQEDYAQRALELARAIQNQHLEVFALDNLGAAELCLGQTEQAREHLELAYQIGKALNTLAETAGVLIDLALCCLASGDLERAGEVGIELETMFQAQAGELADEQRVLWVLAQVHRAQGHDGEAAALAARAFQLVEDKCAAIPEAELRQTYRNLSYNRQIIAAHVNRHWPT